LLRRIWGHCMVLEGLRLAAGVCLSAMVLLAAATAQTVTSAGPLDAVKR